MRRLIELIRGPATVRIRLDHEPAVDYKPGDKVFVGLRQYEVEARIGLNLYLRRG